MCLMRGLLVGVVALETVVLGTIRNTEELRDILILLLNEVKRSYSHTKSEL